MQSSHLCVQPYLQLSCVCMCSLFLNPSPKYMVLILFTPSPSSRKALTLKLFTDFQVQPKRCLLPENFCFLTEINNRFLLNSHGCFCIPFLQHLAVWTSQYIYLCSYYPIAHSKPLSQPEAVGSRWYLKWWAQGIAQNSNSKYLLDKWMHEWIQLHIPSAPNTASTVVRL